MQITASCFFVGAFDPSIPEEGPSVPPAGWLDSVVGYEDHKDGGIVLLL